MSVRASTSEGASVPESHPEAESTLTREAYAYFKIASNGPIVLNRDRSYMQTDPPSSSTLLLSCSLKNYASLACLRSGSETVLSCEMLTDTAKAGHGGKVHTPRDMHARNFHNRCRTRDCMHACKRHVVHSLSGA